MRSWNRAAGRRRLAKAGPECRIQCVSVYGGFGADKILHLQ